MEVNITPNTEKSQVELKITVPAQDFSIYLERATKELSTEKPIAGFRPGKVPISVAAETFGKERVLRAAMDKAIPNFFVQAVIDNDVEAINRPSITVEELNLDAPLRFTAVVDVLPQVTLSDSLKLTAKKQAVAVTDEEIERELQHLAKMRSTFIDVAQSAKKGNTVTVDFKVSMNGSVIEGGESKNHPVTLGEGHFVPDFEKKLEGIAAGEERTFTISFPDDFAQEKFQGKQADVWVKAHAVQKRVLPKLDDDFAKKIGKFKDFAHLKAELTKNLKKEREQKELERYRGELSEQLAQSATFAALPPVLIEKEIDQRIAEFSQMLSMQQKTIDDYLAAQKKTLQQLRDDLRDTAERSVKTALALKELAKREHITVSDEEIEAKVNDYLQRFASTKQAKEQVDKHDLREHIATTLRNQKTLARLEELAEKK